MELRLGTWAKAGGFVGITVAAGNGTVTLFDPGERRMTSVPAAEVAPLPAGAVTVTVRVDVPLPHGVEEGALRRWVASLTDGTLRERAREALAGAGLDEAPALPDVRLEVIPGASGGALCLCGARTPAPEGAAIACAACGRQAVSRPPRTG